MAVKRAVEQRYRAINHLEAPTSASGLRLAVDGIVNRLWQFGLDNFDAIAFRGLSGSIIAPAVAYHVNKPVIAVRTGKGDHSQYTVESGYPSGLFGRYVIVDDLIASGNTMRQIHREVAEAFPQLKPVGIFLYQDDRESGYYNYATGEITVPIRQTFSFVSEAEEHKNIDVPIYGFDIRMSPLYSRIR